MTATHYEPQSARPTRIALLQTTNQDRVERGPGHHPELALEQLLALAPAPQPPELLVESYVDGRELAVWVIGREPIAEQQVVLEGVDIGDAQRVGYQ